MVAALSPADINYDETLSTLRWEKFIRKYMFFLVFIPTACPVHAPHHYNSVVKAIFGDFCIHDLQKQNINSSLILWNTVYSTLLNTFI